MTDLTKEADDIISRLRAERPGQTTRKFIFVTRAVAFPDSADLEDAALLIESTIEKVSAALELVNAPLYVLDVSVTPILAVERGVILTLKLG